MSRDTLPAIAALCPAPHFQNGGRQPELRLCQVETFSNIPPPTTLLEATMIFSRLAQSAAALALLTIGFAAPAQAQENKQIISGTWYEDRAVAQNGLSQLVLTFTQTPSDKFLNVTNVSCSVNMFAGQIMNVMNLYAGTTSGANDLGRPYSVLGPATIQTTSTAKFFTIVTNQVYYKFGPGRFPSIEIDTETSSGNTFTTANCVIVGNLTDN
jgi:hypothetical protein